MKYDPETEEVELTPEAIEDRRPFEDEDLYHIRTAILEAQADGALSCPGLEAVYHQVKLRVDEVRGR